MKLTIIENYTDKHTREFIPKGAIVEATEERAKEIIARRKAVQFKEEKHASQTKELKNLIKTK